VDHIKNKSLTLVKSTDPVLRQICDEFDFVNSPFDPIEFAYNLVKTMHEYNGLGLAANQVGIKYRIFAMKGQPNFCCFNPRIIVPSDEKLYLEEGCLTWPGLAVKVKRSQHVKVRFQTPGGDTLTKTFTGISARVFQHETDYLNGVLFFERATRYHREFAFRRWERERDNKRISS
jgi:peptide deformylase